jgi:hypothetical protein
VYVLSCCWGSAGTVAKHGRWCRSARARGRVNASAAYQISVQGGMMSAGAVVGFVYGAIGLRDHARRRAVPPSVVPGTAGAGPPPAPAAGRSSPRTCAWGWPTSAYPPVMAVGAAGPA